MVDGDGDPRRLAAAGHPRRRRDCPAYRADLCQQHGFPHAGTLTAVVSSAYRSSLALAAQHGLASVVFPSISTGIFGYPVAEAARVALAAVYDALAEETSIALVRFVLWGDQALGGLRVGRPGHAAGAGG